ncbi:mitochondrial peroxiredoxin PRX1 [Xylariomycetidae sp. FL0641]|nr:mitochondrial peroxiredoxin PRX1 [Xylariomycetidae sp. FL0641]
MASLFARGARSVFRASAQAPRLSSIAAGARQTKKPSPTFSSSPLQPASSSSSSSRRFLNTSREQPRLRLGSEAPNFRAQTTHGEIDFHRWLGGSWAVLFSHPADFTPVCTTELGAFARLAPEFARRGVKMIGLSADDAGSHERWVADIDELSRTRLQFPIIADPGREVAWLYDMVDQQDLSNVDQKGIAFTIRSVFVIDPRRKIRLTMMYPASTGRNTAEVLRVIDSLQTGDEKGVTTPIDWQVGEDVIVPPTVSTEDAKKKFGEVRELKPYLRYTKV